MDNESNRELDRPYDEDGWPAGDDSDGAEQGAAARSEPADSGMPAAAEWEGGERPRLPSIDDYDWERDIERLARRLSPHAEGDEADEDLTGDGAADARVLRRAAEPPPFLRRAMSNSAAQAPQWREPASRRPGGKLMAVAVPALAIAAALPIAYGMPLALTDAIEWFPGDSAPPAVAAMFTPVPSGDPALLRRHHDAAPQAVSRQPRRSGEAAARLLLYPGQGVPSVEPAEALALAAARERLTRRAEEPHAIPARAVVAPSEPARIVPASVEAVAQQPSPSRVAPARESAAEADMAGSTLPRDDEAASQRSLPSAQADQAAGKEPALRSLSSHEIDDLLTRGHRLLEIGDIASARLLFQLVAEAGDPRGAKAMGMTFDPSVFAELPVAGMAHDRAQAELWYDRSDAMPALTEPAEGGGAHDLVRAADGADRAGGRRSTR